MNSEYEFGPWDGVVKCIKQFQDSHQGRMIPKGRLPKAMRPIAEEMSMAGFLAREQREHRVAGVVTFFGLIG